MNIRIFGISLMILAIGLTGSPAWAVSTSNGNSKTMTKSSGSHDTKVIKDATEYNTYITALNTKDPVQKAAAMEAFITKYPNSVIKIDALEQAMAAYQQAGNAEKVEETANRILKFNPNHIRALAIRTFLERNRATQGNKDALSTLGADAKRGISLLKNWQKPKDITDSDFEKMRNQMVIIFYGAAGFDAMQTNNYLEARSNYLKSVDIDPGNLQDIFQLSVAELQMNPLDVTGFWHIARAIDIAKTENNTKAVASMEAYGKAKYHKYHGSDEGWDNLLTQATNETTLPKDFVHSIKPAPGPAEIAVEAVQKYDPSQLSFSDREFILSFRDVSAANKDAADKVWNSIQELEKNGTVRLRIPSVKVISVSPNTLEVAITEENQKSGKADLHVALSKPMQQPLEPGSIVTVVGILKDYTPQPFIFNMTQGEVAISDKNSDRNPDKN